MQASSRVLLANCIYPSPFGDCSTINCFFRFYPKDLSVALLSSSLLCSVFKVRSRRRKVRLPAFPPCGENFGRSLAPPLQIEPASLGFDLIKGQGKGQGQDLTKPSDFLATL